MPTFLTPLFLLFARCSFPETVAKKIKLSSSAGVDDVNSKLPTNNKHVSAAHSCLLFSRSLSTTGCVPDDYETGDKESPLDYRPVSFTGVPCKVVGRIVYSQIVQFLDSVNFFPSLAAWVSKKGFLAKLDWAPSSAICMLARDPTYKPTPFF